ncbi:MAG TPA: glycosyltransferase family A protein [Chitinophagaceae bacterium]|nr:glycosyltransferase family A protein [Chitinophagaceae bacterium]
MNPFFSIVVPTYNRADLIKKTIESLLGQTYRNFEIIVVDDGSTDNTDQVIGQIQDDRLTYVKKGNAERAAARNFGAAMAKGGYVNFFDSDDIALPNHLEEAAQLLNRQPEAEWFHLGYAWATPEGQIFRNVNHFSGPTLNRLICNGNPLSCNGVFIRRDIIQAHPFNEDRALSASEDYELWCRLTARYPLYYTNAITSLVIDHEMRSVRTIHGEKLINRLQLLVQYLEQDEQAVRYFGKDFSKIKMDANSYIALHLANAPKYKLKSLQFLFKALKDDVALLGTKRFYATIKNILIQW